MDSIRRVLRFVAWFGVICASLGAAHFGIRCVTEFQFIVRLSQLRELLMLVRFGSQIVLEGISILLLIGCIGLLGGRANARTLCIIWALCSLAVGLSIDLAVIAHGWQAMIREKWLWTIQTLIDRLFQSGLPLTLLGILSIPQIITAFTKPRGFEVLRGAGVIPETSARAILVEEGDSVRDTDVERNLARRLAITGIILGWAGTYCAIQWSFSRYYGTFNHYLSGKWRDPVIVFLDWATLLSFVLLLLGAILLFLNRKGGRKIVIIWSIGFVVLSLGTFAFHEVPIMWWNATRPGMPVRYIIGDFIFYLYQGLQLCAFAIIAATVLTINPVQPIELSGH